MGVEQMTRILLIVQVLANLNATSTGVVLHLLSHLLYYGHFIVLLKGTTDQNSLDIFPGI